VFIVLFYFFSLLTSICLFIVCSAFATSLRWNKVYTYFVCRSLIQRGYCVTVLTTHVHRPLHSMYCIDLHTLTLAYSRRDVGGKLRKFITSSWKFNEISDSKFDSIDSRFIALLSGVYLVLSVLTFYCGCELKFFYRISTEGHNNGDYSQPVATGCHGNCIDVVDKRQDSRYCPFDVLSPAELLPPSLWKHLLHTSVSSDIEHRHQCSFLQYQLWR